MPVNQTIKSRLILFISHLGMGQGRFEKACELPNGYVSNIRVSITPKKLQQITEHFPELNAGWLMTGEGKMLKDQQQALSQSINGDNNFLVGGDNISPTKASGQQFKSIDTKELILQKDKIIDQLLEEQKRLHKQIDILQEQIGILINKIK